MKLDSIKINGKALDLGCDKRECLVTVDSGTSYLGFPEWAIDKSKNVMPNRVNTLPCDKADDFGEMTFVINGNEYTLPNSDWMFEATEKPGQPKKTCRSTVAQRDVRREMFIIGDIFIRNYYSIFDRDNDRVGLAKKVISMPIEISEENKGKKV